MQQSAGGSSKNATEDVKTYLQVHPPTLLWAAVPAGRRRGGVSGGFGEAQAKNQRGAEESQQRSTPDEQRGFHRNLRAPNQGSQDGKTIGRKPAQGTRYRSPGPMATASR